MRDYEELDALQENAYLKDRVEELEIEVENLELENFELKEFIEELEKSKRTILEYVVHTFLKSKP